METSRLFACKFHVCELVSRARGAMSSTRAAPELHCEGQWLFVQLLLTVDMKRPTGNQHVPTLQSLYKTFSTAMR